jgi:hypothetical protein
MNNGPYELQMLILLVKIHFPLEVSLCFHLAPFLLSYFLQLHHTCIPIIKVGIQARYSFLFRPAKFCHDQIMQCRSDYIALILHNTLEDTSGVGMFPLEGRLYQYNRPKTLDLYKLFVLDTNYPGIAQTLSLSFPKKTCVAK